VDEVRRNILMLLLFMLVMESAWLIDEVVAKGQGVSRC